MRRRAALIRGLVVLLVGVAGVAGWRWWDDRPPYGPEALAARATLRLVDPATADAAFAPADGVRAGTGDQLVLGQVSWNPPPAAPPPHVVATTTTDPGDLMVALVCEGSPGQVHWAQRLLH